MPNVSQVLNKVEVSVKITEMGFLFIKVHNLGCKKGKKKEQWKVSTNTATNSVETR